MMIRRFIVAALLLAAAGLGLGQGAASSSPASAAGSARTSASASRPTSLPTGAIARLGFTRLMHGGTVQALQFSPDGKYLLSAGANFSPYVGPGGRTASQLVRLWDARIGEEVRLLSDKVVGDPSCVSFAAGGKSIILPESAKSLAVVDVATGQQTGSLAGTCIFAVAPDGDTLAIVGEDAILRLWSLKDDKELAKLGKVSHPSFSPDGKLLAVLSVANNAETLQILEVPSGKEKQKIDLGQTAAARNYRTGNVNRWSTQAVISPDGKTVVACYTSMPMPKPTAAAYEVETGKQSWKTEMGNMGYTTAQIAFVGDGKLLMQAMLDVSFLNAQKGESEGETIEGDRRYGQITAAAVSADGSMVAFADGSGKISICSPATRKLLLRNADLAGAAISRDGRLVATADKFGLVQVWDVASSAVTAMFGEETKAGIAALDLSADGRRVALAQPDQVLVYQVSSPKTPTSMKADFQVSDVRFSADGKRVGVAGSTGMSMAAGIFDLEGKLLKGRRFDAGIALGAVAISGDLSSVAGRPKNLNVMGIAVGDIESGSIANFTKLTGNYMGQSDLSICLSDAGDLVVSTAWAVTGATITESLTGGQAATINTTQFGQPTVSLLSPDRRLLAVGYIDGALNVWELPSKNKVAAFAGHRMRIASLAFSADSRRLVSASSDGSAVVWDTSGLRQQSAATTEPAELQKQWDALTELAETAYGATFKLIDAGSSASAMLAEKLQPAKDASADEVKTIKSLIEGLSAGQYSVRQESFKQLSAMGNRAQGQLRQAAEKEQDAEAKESIAKLLENLSAVGVTDKQLLRTLRAILVLREIHDQQAVKALKALAGGAASPQTDAAKVALAELGVKLD